MAKETFNVPLHIKQGNINDDGTFEGMGSLFDKNPDSYGDLISKGAFKKSLSKGGHTKAGVAMLYQHDPSLVAGVWTELYENEQGLVAKGKLALKTQLGADIYEIMKLGVETGKFNYGLSIGFESIKEDIDRKTGIRTIQEADLWELSIVTFPAKIGAGVTTVKMIQDAKNERELEKILRDAGLSKKVSQFLVCHCKKSLRDAGGADTFQILNDLKQVNSNLEEQAMKDILYSLRSINKEK